MLELGPGPSAALKTNWSTRSFFHSGLIFITCVIQTFHLAPSLGQLNVKIPAILLPSLLASAVLGTRHVLAYVFIRNYSSPTELAIQHHKYSIFIAQVAVSLLELFREDCLPLRHDSWLFACWQSLWHCPITHMLPTALTTTRWLIDWRTHSGVKEVRRGALFMFLCWVM